MIAIDRWISRAVSAANERSAKQNRLSSPGRHLSTSTGGNSILQKWNWKQREAPFIRQILRTVTNKPRRRSSFLSIIFPSLSFSLAFTSVAASFTIPEMYLSSFPAKSRPPRGSSTPPLFGVDFTRLRDPKGASYTPWEENTMRSPIRSARAGSYCWLLI